MAKVITHVRRETRNSIDYIKNFDGMFAEIDINKNINEDLLIIPSYELNREETVIIDNEEFEQVFNVYSKNKIMALRILNPYFTNEIMDIYKDSGFTFSLAIKQNKIYICFYVKTTFDFKLGNQEKVILDFIKYININKNIDLYMKRIIKSINELEV